MYSTEILARMLRVVCLLFIAMELGAVIPRLNGEVFAVGGAAGWTIPKTGMVNYTEWAAMLSSLNVGDTLLFTYPAGQHNVVQVGEEDFGRCRTTSPIATFNDGQTLINLQREGRYWFICGFNGHCDLGQKFVVDVITLPAFRSPAPAPTLGGPNGGVPKDSTSPAAVGPAFAPSASSLSISPALGPSTPDPDNSAPTLRMKLLATVSFALLCFIMV